MEGLSLSQLKYCSLGQKVKTQVSIEELLPLSASNESHELPLSPTTNTGIKINRKHEYDENNVQEFMSSWLCNTKICGKYWVHDMHDTLTFLDGLKPDYFVSTENKIPYGEAHVAFFIDVKHGKVNPATDTNIGQAAAYCIKLLEISAPARRHSASCLVTNMYNAAVVTIKRDGNGGWIFRKAVLDAELALYTMFNADSVIHGTTGRTIPVMINNQAITLVKYLGSGATGVVYETEQKYAVKFFINASKDLKEKEKHILETLFNDKPKNVLLQQVIDSDEKKFWPALLLKPVGKAISPRYNFSFRREYSFFSILETLKYAHSRGIIHNDIRPENIIAVEEHKWLLIDWAASWDLNTCTNRAAYCGCVTYASDSVLSQLAESHESALEEDCNEYLIDCPSILSDLISLFRTMYVFTCRISNDDLNELMNLRANHKFTDIITWWAQHLSQTAKDAESLLTDAFNANPQGIHAVAAELAMKILPERI